MTPVQLKALEDTVEWMDQQSVAASTIASRDRSDAQRQLARGRSDAHRMCANRLRRVLAGLR